MKTTDFAQCLASYLTMYLPGQLGLSENTIMAYRDAFKDAGFIAGFLRWLEQECGCCAATRNQRLAALRAFARYARIQHPAYLFESWTAGYDPSLPHV